MSFVIRILSALPFHLDALFFVGSVKCICGCFMLYRYVITHVYVPMLNFCWQSEVQTSDVVMLFMSFIRSRLINLFDSNCID